jgi:hypothetical protein
LLHIRRTHPNLPNLLEFFPNYLTYQLTEVIILLGFNGNVQPVRGACSGRNAYRLAGKVLPEVRHLLS